MNIETLALPFAIIAALIVYILGISLVPKDMLKNSDPRLKASLRRLKEEQHPLREGEEGADVLPGTDYLNNPFTRAFLFLPGAQYAMPMIRKAGWADKLDKLLLSALGIFVILSLITSRYGAIAVVLSAIITFVVIYLFLKSRVSKIRRQFIDAFPDALDMIVRSVRSGYPLNAALNMVSENIGPPISTEFKRIVDEMNYGWSLQEALVRFANRIKEQDVDFFVVVLTIQQETGGNLSEVLNNLSNVLRQRKQLRLKIRALSSEGRATGWVLGLLPILMLSAVEYTSPGYFMPLFHTAQGWIYFLSVVAVMATGFLIVKKIINIEI